MIDSFSPTGFTVNGVSLKGSLLLLPHLRLFFNVPTLQQLTPRSLDLLRLVKPEVELLLIGSGEQVRCARRVSLRLLNVPWTYVAHRKKARHRKRLTMRWE